jgi:hypothetical protein
LARQVAAYRAAGEPIEMSDFVVRGVADDDNAVIPLREAAASIDEKTEVAKKFDRFPNQFELPLTDQEAAAIRDMGAANTTAFDKVDEAMTRKGVD